jgi:hypothetical protein
MWFRKRDPPHERESSSGTRQLRASAQQIQQKEEEDAAQLAVGRLG